MKNTCELTEVALFLLKYPPLSEIGGLISQIIEDYRDGFYTEEIALKILQVEHKEYIKKYIERAKEITVAQSY